MPSSYRPQPQVWTEHLDAELMEHVAQERSFTEIGKIMGVSKDQASGRFKRLRDAMGGQAK